MDVKIVIWLRHELYAGRQYALFTVYNIFHQNSI